MLKKYFILIALVCKFIFAQNEILPAQMSAIKTLAYENGFSDEQLNNYLLIEYRKNLDTLTRNQAITIINLFQSSNPPKPSSDPPAIAETLEVGMSKIFYLTDGNRIMGKINEISNGRCHIETAEGMLKIPMTDILEETIDIIKTDDARYKGPLISEDEESLLIRSKYGDVTIYKREIKKMDRYHGGKLIPWVENKKKFHQGAEELIGVFRDNNAFVLDPNTFFLSGLSVGYGFTDRFMITTQFGAALNRDLNLYPKHRFWYKKTSKQEKALAWGMGIHRAYPTRKLIGDYSHAWYVNGNKDSKLNRMENITSEDLDEFIPYDDQTKIYISPYIVYSSKRKNPTGRGKVGYSIGFRTNNMKIVTLKEYICSSNDCPKDNNENSIESITYDEDNGQYAFPFRAYATFEYDLQKKLKFVAAMWLDNSSRSVDFEDVIDDYFGENGDSFSFDGLGGDYNLFDIDFGFQYAINDNFRLGLHFQQPYIEFYWEFFEL